MEIQLSQLLVFILIFNIRDVLCRAYVDVHHLDAGDVVKCCDSSYGTGERLPIYCYDGREKHIVHLFETVLLEISIPPDDYTLYEGNSVSEVVKEFESHRSLWNMNFLSWKRKDVKLNPFNSTCIGIVTNSNYQVELNVLRIDFWRVILFVGGLLLFFLGPRLSNNLLFYYICGISFGIIASALILIYIMSRLFPRKPLMYGFIVGGWAISLYVLQILFENTRILLDSYRKYVIGYFAVTGFISFIVCYRFGPVTDTRSKNIIKWMLQAAGLAFIMFSSHFQEATLAVDIILLLMYSIPKTWLSGAKKFYLTYFYKPKPRLLSEDEYYEEGVKETAKALEELRGFCSSPKCDQWNTILKLKDPVRFAKFIQGDSHLYDNEILAFETENIKHSAIGLNGNAYTDESDSD